MITPDNSKPFVTVEYHNLPALVSPFPAPAPTIIEVAGSVQSSARNYFATIDLANMFHPVFTLIASQPLHLPSQWHNIPFTHVASQHHFDLTSSLQGLSLSHAALPRVMGMTSHWRHPSLRRFIGHTQDANTYTAAGEQEGPQPSTQPSPASVKFLGVIWFIKYCSVPDIVMKHRLTLVEPTILTQAQYLLGPLVF